MDRPRYLLEAFGCYAAFSQQLKATVSSFASMAFLLGFIPQSIVFAWIASTNPDRPIVDYLWFGIPLFALWSGAVFRVGWSLTVEAHGETLGHTVISRTSLTSVMFGKSLAQIAYGLPNSLLALIPLWWLVDLPPVKLWVAVPGMFLAFVGVAVCCLVLGPALTLLAANKEGAFNGIIPLGAILGCFLIPLDTLPDLIQWPAMIFPSAWALHAIWSSLTDPGDFSEIFICLLISGGLTGLWLLAALSLFRIAEIRLRRTGGFSS